jgi:hypothetical protein
MPADLRSLSQPEGQYARLSSSVGTHKGLCCCIGKISRTHLKCDISQLLRIRVEMKSSYATLMLIGKIV